MCETEIVSCRVLNNKSYYHCFTTIKFAKPSWRSPQSMIPFIANPTNFVKKYRTARIYSPWRFLPPRNTPDSFCRLLHPTKSSLRCVGGIFLFREQHLENFMSRPNVIPTFRQRRCTNRGRNFVRSKRRSTYTSSGTLYLFLRLNNSETFVDEAFWAQR